MRINPCSIVASDSQLRDSYIKYTVNLDPKDLNASKCNCTWCQKRNFIAISLKDPENEFKLVAPKSKDDIDDYNPKTEATEAGIGDGHRWFCAKCGCHVWGEGLYKFGDTKYDHFSINLGTIDQPQDGIDVSETKVTYIDGLHNNW